jgi:predicted HAD superfamily Cof-like phosphohydrolase
MSIFHEQYKFMSDAKQAPNPSLYIDLVDEEVNQELFPAWRDFEEPYEYSTAIAVKSIGEYDKRLTEWLRSMGKDEQAIGENVYRELVSRLAISDVTDSSAYPYDLLVPLVDGAIDSIYVLAGLLNSLIGPDKALACWNEVQASNMSKIAPEGVKLRPDGKILKPDSYFKPNLATILNDSV